MDDSMTSLYGYWFEKLIGPAGLATGVVDTELIDLLSARGKHRMSVSGVGTDSFDFFS